MSSRIKFRAWDKHNKTMEWVETLLWQQGSTAPSVKLRGRGAEAPPNHYSELMQFTGLEDKNGKDIYEGDIVKAIAAPQFKENDYVSDVIRDMTDTSWAVRTPSDDGEPYNFGLHLKWWKSLEVIGNIYENKELLK